MKKEILITLDRLKYPNCGLGRYSIDFGEAISLINDPEHSFNFLLPRKGYQPFENQKHIKCIKLDITKKYINTYQKKFDLIHITHQLPSFKINPNIKKIITIHDLNHLITKDLKKSEQYLKRIQTNINNSDGVIFISNFTKDCCTQNLILPSDKIYTVIHNGINIPNILATRPHALKTTKKYLFTIGQVQPKKNFHTLIPFLSKISDEYDLVIAGELCNVQYTEKIKAEITKLQLENRVHLLGSISEAEKRYLYENCEAFVFPSIAEGFGMPVIEAMRFKKPVFSSDKTSLAEIGDKFANFWRNFDADYMSEIFIKVMAKTNQEHIEAAFRYSEKYSWESNVRQHLQFYGSLLNK